MGDFKIKITHDKRDLSRLKAETIRDKYKDEAYTNWVRGREKAQEKYNDEALSGLVGIIMFIIVFASCPAILYFVSEAVTKISAYIF